MGGHRPFGGPRAAIPSGRGDAGSVKIKGSSLLARKDLVTRQFGAPAWLDLIDGLALKYPYFASPVVASSLVPMREFLAFHDELVNRFFGGKDDIYFRLGEESANWAFTSGPYRKFFARKDVGAFVDSIPRLSGAYWESSATSYRATLDRDVVDLFVSGLPTWHPYFEYVVVGYIKASLARLCGGEIATERVVGGKGSEYHYRFRLPKQPPPAV